MWIPRNFPQKSIRILEIARVPAPTGFHGLFLKLCSSGDGLSDDIVNGLSLSNVMRKGESSKSRACGFDLSIFGQLLSRVERKPGASRREECNSSWSIPHRESESVAIEFNRTVEILDTERNQRDSCIHEFILPYFLCAVASDFRVIRRRLEPLGCRGRLNP